MAAGFQFAGPAYSALVDLSALMVVASLLLWLAGLWRGGWSLPHRRTRPEPRWIVVDGSNVMHWADNAPMLGVVASVLADLKGRGFYPLIWFDANVGYKVEGRYIGPDRLARHLRLDPRQVSVAPRGTPADPLLLTDAQRLNARIVTNDRFRDWAESHPRVAEPGFLIRGGWRLGRVTLDLGDEVADQGERV